MELKYDLQVKPGWRMRRIKRDLSQALRLALFLLAVGQVHVALVRWVWG